MQDLTEEISEKDRMECVPGLSIIVPPDWTITTQTPDSFVMIPRNCIGIGSYDDSMSIFVANRPAPDLGPGSDQAKEVTHGRLLGQECIIHEVDLEPEFPHPGYYWKSFFLNYGGIPREITYRSTQFGKPHMPDRVMKILESIRYDG